MKLRDVLPREAIPSVDDPEFGSGYFGEPDDEVIVVEADPPRAYPVRILSYHEIVNDHAGEPIAVTWCPICWSAAVYSATVGGRALTFGVSGKLADDALVMYDRETESEWKQPTGEAIAGELAGERLDHLAAPMVPWERFREEHPDGVVLQPPREPGPGQSYADVYDMDRYERYVEGPEFGLYGMRGEGERRSWDREDLDPKTVVLGIEAGGEAVAYPRPRIEEAGGVLTDTIGGLDVVVFASEAGVHAFEDPGYAFEPGGDGDRDSDGSGDSEGLFAADGTLWDGTTGESEDGRRLDRVPAKRLFAFAWQDDHGPDAFY